MSPMFGAAQRRGPRFSYTQPYARLASQGFLIALFSCALFAETSVVCGPETLVQNSSRSVDFTRTFTVRDPSTTYVLRIDNASAKGELPGINSGTVTLNGDRIVGPRDFNQVSRGADNAGKQSDTPVDLIRKIVNLSGKNKLVVHLDSNRPGKLTIQIIGVKTFTVFGPEDFIRQYGKPQDVLRTFTVTKPNETYFLRITMVERKANSERFLAEPSL